MYNTFLSVANEDARASTDLSPLETEREMLFKFEFMSAFMLYYGIMLYVYIIIIIIIIINNNDNYFCYFLIF